MIPILSHTSESYASLIRARLGKGERHAKLLYKEWFLKGRCEGKDPAFGNAGRLKEEILAMTDFSLPKMKGNLAEGETGKFLLETQEGLEIESVLLPMKAGWTLCLSSQIGCKMGCAFCQTAKMGLIRSLRTEEIVAQLFHAKHTLKTPVRNLVFMGMGEPLDNFEAVKEAVAIFCDPASFGLGKSHITISTSGVVDKIKSLIDNDLGINLAVSVNAPSNEVRNKLMPINLRHSMEELKEVMALYCHTLKRKIFIEYVLIAGKTDSLEDAERLALFLRWLDVTVNLIPYNPMVRGPFLPPTPSVIAAFSSRLQELGYLTFVRTTFGQRIMAACGQLGNRNSFIFSRKKSTIENVAANEENSWDEPRPKRSTSMPSIRSTSSDAMSKSPMR